MLYHIEAYIIGFLLDLLIGKPQKLEKIIKKLFSASSVIELEKLNGNIIIKKCLGFINKNVTFIKGTILAVIIEVGLIIAFFIHPILGVLYEALLTYCLLGVKKIRQDSANVYKAMVKGDKTELREKLLIMSDDDKPLLSNRNVAECTTIYMARRYVSDGIFPMFYMMLGGPALAVLAKVWSGKFDAIYKLPDTIGSWFIVTISFIFGKAFNGKISSRFRVESRTIIDEDDGKSVLAWLGSLCVKYKFQMKSIDGTQIRDGQVIDIYRSNQLLYGSIILGEIAFTELLMIVVIVIMFL